MRVDVALVPQEIEGKSFEHITAIVIDVLRASTCIANAIANGCDGVIPTVSVEEAMDISRAYSRDDYLLCGERKNEKIDGFDLGNSCLLYTSRRHPIKILPGSEVWLVVSAQPYLLIPFCRSAP